MSEKLKVEQDKGNQNSHLFLFFKGVTLEANDQHTFTTLEYSVPCACIYVTVERSTENGEHLTLKMFTSFSPLLPK